MSRKKNQKSYKIINISGDRQEKGEGFIQIFFCAHNMTTVLVFEKYLRINA